MQRLHFEAENAMKGLSVDGGSFSRSHQTRRTCPDCNGFVYRVPRRFVDRFISLIFPVRRYRCSSLGCDWEGSLRKAAFPPE